MTDISPYTTPGLGRYDGEDDSELEAVDGEVVGEFISDLSLLAADAEEDISRTVDYPINRVKGREGYVLRVQVGTLDSDDTKKWAAIATPKGKRGDDPQPNMSYWNALIIGNQTEAILKDGKPFVNSDSEPVTFKDPELLAALGVAKVASAVTKFIGSDPVLLSIGQAIIRDAGFGDEADRVDPTETAR